MFKVLITGGAGFIGSHLAEAALRAGLSVVVIDDLSYGRRAYVPQAATFHKLDVRSPQLSILVRKLKPDYICHLAAQRSVVQGSLHPAQDAAVNIVGSLNLIEAARTLDLKKFLFVSTAALYGAARELPTGEEAEQRPSSPYALAKQTVERYLNYYAQGEGLPVVVVRPSNVYGPRQDASSEGGVVAQFARAALHNEVLLIEGRGEQTRDFIYVTDVASGLLAALQSGFGVYNLSSGQEVSIRELVVRLGEVLGSVPKVNYAPARAGDIGRSCLASRRAERELGFEPQVPLLEGLRLQLKWLSEQK
ncbi:MAG: NAD-dependent epimerase/dehydratase family protein [Candidatus Kerfeldbacteria bacterium]|nr:NAD-dependent epimerase/dehydratase family protein [Candidatus Kerfeldbacteria bacterium]